MAASRELSRNELRSMFAEPGTAIDGLHRDLLQLWDHYRSDDWNSRRIGTLHMANDAYVQWIGYPRELVVEVSSNTYLPADVQLSTEQQRLLLTAGFAPPDEDEPNYWLVVQDRAEAGRAAFAIVAVLTSVFGVYAG